MIDTQVKTFKDAVIHLKNFNLKQNYKSILKPLISESIRLYRKIPESFRPIYEKEFVQIVKNIKLDMPLNSEHYKAVQALNYEKKTLLSFVAAGEELSHNALKIKNSTKYLKYDKSAKVRTLLNIDPIIPEGMLLQNDVPLVRHKNGIELPYIFETKYYPSSKFGSRGKDLNQLLKYQKALETNLISGITLNINGRLSSQFTAWLKERSHLIPDVRITYSIDLPSHKKYTIVIKDSNDQTLVHPLENTELFDSEDIKIIRGIEASVKDNKFMDLISTGMDATHLVLGSEDTIKAMLEPNNMNKLYLKNPQDITDIDMYLCFIANMQKFLWDKFKTYEPEQTCNLEQETINM